jgi:O-methyltransferase
MPDPGAIEQFHEALFDHIAMEADSLPEDPASQLIATLLRERRAFVDVTRMRHLVERATSYTGRSGAFVECGVAKGASLAVLAAYAGERTVWGFDSFEGLPEQTEGDGGDGAMFVGYSCSGERGEAAVADTFAMVGVPMDHVRLVRGWFSDTLPVTRASIGPIAILRIDADWYEGTRYVLDQLHEQVMPGGTVLVDDYESFAGCHHAVAEFLATRPDVDLQVGATGEGFWIKP